MARPIKKGLDYFPLDVNFFSNKKIKVLKSRFGADGVVIYLYILCEAYKENGYYAKNDDDFVDVVADDLNMSGEKVGQVINFLCGRSLLDSKLFVSDKVLTSHGIQTRFQSAIKSRAAKVATEVKGKYWVLSKNETLPYVKVTQNPNYSENNPSYSEKNPHYSEKNSTKESKEKKSIVNKSKEEKRKNGGYDEILSVIEDEELKSLYYEFIKMRKLIKSPMTDRALITLIDKVNKLEPTNIERRKQLLENSIVNNWKSVYPLKDDETDVKSDRQKSFENQNNKKPQRSRFNNYEDVNVNAYANLENILLEDMLKEAKT